MSDEQKQEARVLPGPGSNAGQPPKDRVEQIVKAPQPQDVDGDLRFAVDKVYCGALSKVTEAMAGLHQITSTAKKVNCERASIYASHLNKFLFAAFRAISSAFTTDEAHTDASEASPEQAAPDA